MKYWSRLILMAFAGTLVSCDSPESDAFDIFSSSFDFNAGLQGWEADFTDYPASTDEDDSIYQWKFGYSELPAYVGAGRKAIMLSCNNVNGDVFMFLKKRLSGFQPNTDYSLVFEIELASNALTSQGVILKAGASNIEPKKVIEENTYGLNIDKGSPLTGGEDIIVLGQIGQVSNATEFSLTTKTNAQDQSPFIVRSNSKGEIWLIVGTDSGYQGVTTVYYTKINVVFSVSK